MAIVRAHNLSFAYAALGAAEAAPGAASAGSSVAPAAASPKEALAPTQALGPLSLEIEEGAFCLVTGLTGCGKSTLLRSCKPELAPRGTYQGTLEVCGVALVDDGVPTQALGQEASAMQVGFVMQDPDAQIVCDTVWHELAFGLENLGWPQDAMRRRVAEVAHFFGIAPWVGRRTSQLSDGQKQLVNLAAVLALRPRLMLLDEPTAQLDPVARQQFLSILGRVNAELGVTVVMATHLPEEAARFATQEVQLSALGPQATLDALLAARFASPAMPASAITPAPLPATGASSTAAPSQGVTPATAAPSQGVTPAPVVKARDLFVRFDTAQPWVLQGLDIDIAPGSVHAVVGGNGCGKTTLLRTLAGQLKPRRGKVACACRDAQAFLPQDPKALFVCDTVAEELAEWQASAGYSDASIQEVVQRFGLQGLEARHPYDVSAGQRQSLALAKLLLCRPRLMLLDEPTKGLDASACANVVRQLRQLANEGVAVVLTTHDLDVAAAVADQATLLFDGQAACTQELPAFFEQNLIWRPHRASRLFGALV